MDKSDWTTRNERGLCLLVASLSGATALSAFGDGDRFTDAVSVSACLLGVLATAIAIVAGRSGGSKGE